MRYSSSIRKELVREFIHDALYNKEYGYFSSRVAICKPMVNFDFPKMSTIETYWDSIGQIYETYSKDSLNVWHTATELFNPWFGRAVGHYILQKHLEQRNKGITNDLYIYEIGGGNGTLMMNILDYIREKRPDIYQSCYYILYEISPKLHRLQETLLSQSEHLMKDRVRLICDDVVSNLGGNELPCFVVAIEVLDNLPHDVIVRHQTGELSQIHVCTDQVTGRMWEEMVPLVDSTIIDYVKRMQCSSEDEVPTDASILVKCVNSFKSNFLVEWFKKYHKEYREFIPTISMKLFQKIKSSLPNARLIIGDFSELPNTIDMGVNSPVVQRRLNQETITCSTYLVKRGQCDIFFPTNFQHLSDLWSRLQNHELIHDDYKLGSSGTSQVLDQKSFMSLYADLSRTRLKSGFNPLIDDYKNFKFMLT